MGDILKAIGDAIGEGVEFVLKKPVTAAMLAVGTIVVYEGILYIMDSNGNKTAIGEITGGKKKKKKKDKDKKKKKKKGGKWSY